MGRISSRSRIRRPGEGKGGKENKRGGRGAREGRDQEAEELWFVSSAGPH